MKIILKYKKIVLSLLIISLISSLGIFILGVKQVEAGPFEWMAGVIGGFLGDIAGNAISFSFEAIIGIFLYIGVIIQTITSVFFWFGGMLLEIAFGLEKFTDAGVVQMGWKITRDLSNMFFVLILLIIAFATVLRIETYGMKALLPKLIIIALLINFSLVLSGVIIDFSQVLTHFFYEQIEQGQGISARIAQVIKIQTVFDINQNVGFGEKLAVGAGGVLMVVSSIFLSIALIVCAGFALALGAFFLIVRLIAIWFLLILAPIAWFLGILPATAHLFKQWWSTFLKWVFFAPVYMFFVYLAIKAADGGAFTSIIKTEVETIVTNAGFKDTLSAVMLSTPQMLLQFVCVMGLLFGGLIAAQKMGIYGAQGAMSVAKWFGKGAAGFTNRWLAGGGKVSERFGSGLLTKGIRKIGWEKGARGLEAIGRAKQKAVPYVSPGVWKRAWAARREEAEREAFREPAPALQDKLTSAFSLGKEKSDYLERAKRRERIEERKKIDTTNSEELTNGFEKAKEAGLGSKTAAYAQALAEQGDLNDLLAQYDHDFNAEGISDFTEKQLVPLLGEQDAYRLSHDLNKSSEKVGQWQGRVFKAEYDDGKITYHNLVKENPEPSEKDPEMTKGAEMALKESYKAWSRMDPQERTRFTHRTGFISEDKEGRDMGVKGHEMWIRGIMPEHSKRMSDEVIGTLMLKHAKETKKENPALYKTLSGILESRTDEQITMMKEMVEAKEERMAPGVEISSWKRGEIQSQTEPSRAEPSSAEPSRIVRPTKESFEEARTKAPPGAFG